MNGVQKFKKFQNSKDSKNAAFSILKFALIRSLFSMPLPRLSLIFICAIYLFQSRCSSIKTPRYLTEWVCKSLLPSNLNLKRWSILVFLGLKIISSVFFTLRLNLFALNQFERFDRSLFTCFDNLSNDGLDWLYNACVISKVVCLWESNTSVQVICIDEKEEWGKNWSLWNSCQNFPDWGHIIFYTDKLFSFFEVRAEPFVGYALYAIIVEFS